MSLSNRLWRKIAREFGESEDVHELRVWKKVQNQAHGKRHFIREISLTIEEETSVLRLLNSTNDEHLRFMIRHEYEHNPEFRTYIGG